MHCLCVHCAPHVPFVDNNRPSLAPPRDPSSARRDDHTLHPTLHLLGARIASMEIDIPASFVARHVDENTKQVAISAFLHDICGYQHGADQFSSWRSDDVKKQCIVQCACSEPQICQVHTDELVVVHTAPSAHPNGGGVSAKAIQAERLLCTEINV